MKLGFESKFSVSPKRRLTLRRDNLDDNFRALSSNNFGTGLKTLNDFTPHFQKNVIFVHILLTGYFSG